MTTRLQHLRLALDDLKHVLPLTERILSQLQCPSPPPARLEAVESALHTAERPEPRGQAAGVEAVEQAEAGIQSLRQWLAVADLGISPYLLRTHLEQNPIPAEAQQAMIRHFLEKSPHAESDRDKLDYLLTAYCTAMGDSEVLPRFASEAELKTALAELFGQPTPSELPPPVQIMLHDLESLIARVPDFQDFDELVKARIVERARALKANLGDHFYHPQVLASVVRFNLAFRRHFDQLLRNQLGRVKAQTQAFLETARHLLPAIQEAFQTLPEPSAVTAEKNALATSSETGSRPGAERRSEPVNERAPIENLIRRPLDPEKETELRGIIRRIGRHLAALPPEQAAASRIIFPLRRTTMDLYEWEREAFGPSVGGKPAPGVQVVQLSLGLIAWMEEAFVLYRETRRDRYGWKPHFDSLSYAVERTHDQLHTIHGLLLAGGSEEEVQWFAALVNTAQRLVGTLDKIAPVFG